LPTAKTLQLARRLLRFRIIARFHKKMHMIG
jgi:hypothetical protein